MAQTGAATPSHLIFTADPTKVSPPQDQHCVVTVTSAFAASPETISVGLEFVPAGSGLLSPPVRLIPHIVEGTNGQWKTSLILANTDGSLAGFQLDFRDGDGNDLVLTFGVSGTVSQLRAGSMPVNGSLTWETDGSTREELRGWAELSDLTASGAIDGAAIFRQVGNVALSLVDSEAAVPITSSSTSNFFLPFDNTNSPQDNGAFVTDVAVGNTVSVFFYDEDGNPINPRPDEKRVVKLRDRGHQAFALGSLFPSVAGRRGLAQFVSDSPVDVLEQQRRIARGSDQQ